MNVRAQMTTAMCVAAATTIGWSLAGAWLKSPASPVPATVQSPRPPAPASPAASRRQLWIHTITNAGTPSAQLAAALALSRQVDPADFPNLLKIVRALPGDTLGALLQRAVLSRWLQHDPAAALTYAESQDRELLGETIRAWARLEPAEAIAWFQDAPRRLKNQWTTLALAQGVAPRDPDAALEVVKSMPRPWFADLYGWGRPDLIALFETMAHGHPHWLLERTKGLADELFRPARFAAAGLMARHDVNAFLQWAHTQPDRHDLLRIGLLDPKIPSHQAIAAMAGLSPEDQAHLAEIALDMPRDRFDFIWSAWFHWSPTDAWKALSQIEATPSLDPELRERLIDGLATSDDFENDPASAIAELSRVAPDLRSDWADWLVEGWARKDPVAARTWAASLPEDEGRAELLEAIDESLRPPPSPSSHVEALLVRGIADSPEQRKELLEAYAQPPVGLGIAQREQLQNAAKRIMRSHPSEAASWLATRPQDEPATVNQASRVAARWAREEPVAAADWSAGLPAGRARTWALWNAAAEFHRLDPAAARTWADALPDPRLRTVATQAFTGQQPAP